MKKIYSLTLLILFLNFSTITMANVGITNGMPVTPGKYPWYAAISPKSNPDTSVACGGALISKDWVITAKHCVVDYGSWLPAKIVFGIYDQNNPYKLEKRDVTKIIQYPGKYDVALVKLSSAVNDISPVDISWKKPAAGSSIIIMGFGISHRCGADLKNWCPSTTMMEAITPVQPDSVCANLKYGIVNFHPGYNICVGTLTGSRINAGLGDSGSPGVQYNQGKYKLIGVVSRGPTKAPYNTYNVPTPAVYAAVAPFKNWIEKTIKN